MVHDNRDKRTPITYLAVRGELAQTPGGARLIMLDGTVEESGQSGGQLTGTEVPARRVRSGPVRRAGARDGARQTSERYLSELFAPNPKLPAKLRNAYMAEGHNRLSQPLYCLAFAMIALAAVLRGRRRARRQCSAPCARCARQRPLCASPVMACRAWRSDTPSLMFLFYLIPLLGAAIALAVLAGFVPTGWFRRRAPVEAFT